MFFYKIDPQSKLFAHLEAAIEVAFKEADNYWSRRDISAARAVLQVADVKAAVNNGVLTEARVTKGTHQLGLILKSLS